MPKLINKTLKQVLLGTLLALTSLPLRVAASDSQEWGLAAFSNGETLTYDLRWKVFSAGEVTLTTTPRKDGNDLAYQVVLQARTLGILGEVYPVDTRVESRFNGALECDYVYVKHQQENGYKRDVQVNFDWKRKEIHASKNEHRFEHALSMPMLLDPLSAFFYIRKMPVIEVGKTFTIPITDGEFIEQCPVNVLCIEKVDTDAGVFECYKVEPCLDKVNGIFRKRANAPIYLWVSTDARRLPVMLESKAPVGFFCVRLSRIGSSPLAN